MSKSLDKTLSEQQKPVKKKEHFFNSTLLQLKNGRKIDPVAHSVDGVWDRGYTDLHKCYSSTSMSASTSTSGNNSTPAASTSTSGNNTTMATTMATTMTTKGASGALHPQALLLLLSILTVSVLQKA
ncbi:hypothetical protein Q5P01_022794 [Channa striata]|uniref:Uncharacterized protein n=1 Tax=Channa striata TaxID=64152 RepID=A0AA88S448_CHASR|nr:hypothetical protein Q5P01_022794 [Channa striata]